MHSEGLVDSFQIAGQVDYLATFITNRICFFELRMVGKHFVERRRFTAHDRHHLSQLRRFSIRIFQNSRHIFDHCFAGHAVEGNDLCDSIFTIFVGHVTEHFFAPVDAEISIDIGHRLSFWIQESFEQQVESNRIDVCNAQAICHQTASSGASAWSDWNAFVAGVLNEIADDEEVRGKVHILNYFQLCACSQFEFRSDLLISCF